MLIEYATVVLGTSASFLIGLLLVLTQRWHGKLSMDYTIGIQKFHTTPTPRIGGIAIFLSLLIVWSNSSQPITELLNPILIGGLPAFLFGIAEDLTKRVGTLLRLLATMFSGLMAWWLSDYSLTRLDIWGLDLFLQFTFVSVFLTSFAVGGMANSINIIDGLNGLSSLTCTFAFSGLAFIAYEVGDVNLALTSLALAACIWGFFWINWPFGKMFLGDGGAYFIGFALAWISILLIERNLNVSPFSALLICLFPITEVLFSIFRRIIRKENISKPDRLHLHSLLKRRYISRWFTHWTMLAKNSIAGLIVGLINLLSVYLAITFFQSTMYCLVFIFMLVIGYVSIYARIIKRKWCSPFKFLLLKPLGLTRKI